MASKEEFREKACTRFTQAKEFWGSWRTEARDSYAFITGKQWTDEDEAYLLEQERVPITFNYSEKMIDAILGAEISNRQEAVYQPQGKEDSALAEIWTNAAKYCRTKCNAEDEESDAFKDALVTGLGWTQSKVTYDNDLDGDIIVERVSPFDVYADPAASKMGLSDMRYVFRTIWVDKSEAKRLWPKIGVYDGTSLDTTSDSMHIRTGHRYEDDAQSEADMHKDHIQIIMYECFEREPVYRVSNGQELITVEVKDFNANKEQIDAQGLDHVKQYRKTYYRGVFAGETLLEMSKNPTQSGFTLQAITGKRDHAKNTWYGLTRVMKDPARWANKWLSQVLHIVNSNAKGGIMAEINAFVDPTRAQEEWSQPDSVTLLQEGGLNKVREKGQAPYPQGLDKLMEFAFQSLPMVTGINLEALGLANRDQANSLETQRKQAAYGLLAPWFNALRLYRKNQGRIFLEFINEYISDGRLIRIEGNDIQPFLPLTKQPGSQQYDVTVDSAPNSPDVKQKTWESLVAILPSMLKAGLPLPPSLLDYTPLPAALAKEWKETASQGQQLPPQVQQQMQQMQQQMQQLQQQNQQLQQQLQQDQSTAQQSAAKMQAELELKSHTQQQEIDLKKASQQADFELKSLQMDREFELEQRRMLHETTLKNHQQQSDLRIKAISAGIAPDDETGKVGVDLGIDMTPIADALKSIAETNAQSAALQAKALTELTSAISRPRKIVEDANGKPIGSAPI